MTDYIQRFAKLHRNKNPSRWSELTRQHAPHKPLLLLSVIDLIAEGVIAANLIELTPELGELFTLYWSRVMPPDLRGNLVTPFFHLAYDGFWHLVPQPGKEAELTPGRLRSVNDLRARIFGARLDDELYSALLQEQSRNLLRAVLIETYFAPPAQLALLEQESVNINAFLYSQGLLGQAKKPESILKNVTEPVLTAARDQGFRRAIVTAYAHRCALCGTRIMTADGHSVVDAAHIIPWSFSRNDNPNNGLALCKLCHWSFDEGLVSINDDYVIVMSRHLIVNTNLPGYIVTLEGRGLMKPDREAYWPAIENLGYHRREIFRLR
jgi:putative restriction endonuclease